MVVITHDLRIIKGVDRVAVLKKWMADEEGRFEKLRWKGGVLTRLVGGGRLSVKVILNIVHRGLHGRIEDWRL